MKKSLLIALKGIVAATAIYIAFRHVNRDELKHIGWHVSFVWLLPAIILFNASQCISSYRLLQFYHLCDPGISFRYNLRLYYTGMFYNLFLPGGVGGDVYKVINLKKRGLALAPASKATLLDRITGLLTLLAIMTLLLNFVSTPLPMSLIKICSIAIVPAFIVYWFIVKQFFKPFHRVVFKTALLSIVVQGAQVASFLCLIQFLHGAPGSSVSYTVLFFAGSVIAALPVSIGGIGTRELAMATGAAWLHVSATIAVAASLLFYITTAISAIAGWIAPQNVPAPAKELHTGKKSVEK
jgi:uncharacterized membrane protein YbhN (UPF0104 family)